MKKNFKNTIIKYFANHKLQIYRNKKIIKTYQDRDIKFGYQIKAEMFIPSNELKTIIESI